MGAANAMGHLIVAVAADTVDALWDLLNEFGERSGSDGPTVHAMPSESGEPRYCVHPDSVQEREFRDDDLRRALLLAATWKARQFGEGEMWRREQYERRLKGG